eukprot:m.69285 g.69285  ORF g.69285 m.69285 type:complete len:461 (+) comp14113_c0_seq2:62-1444(+)
MSDLVEVQSGTFSDSGDDTSTPTPFTADDSRPITPELQDLLLADVHVDDDGVPLPQPQLPTHRDAIYQQERYTATTDAGHWFLLSEALTNVLQSHLERVQASDAILDEKNNQDGLTRTDLILQLGEMLSVPLPMTSSYKPADLASLLIPRAQLPNMRMHDPFLALGSKTAIPSVDDVNSSTRLVDIHLPFCGFVLSLQQEFVDLINEDPPLQPAWSLATVKCQWLVFEDSQGAKLYHQRNWRYLSENIIPFAESDVNSRSTTQLYENRVMRRIASWGTDCHVYRSWEMVPLVRYAGYCAGEAIIVTANVGKLVLKLSIASKTETEVDLDALESFVVHLKQRGREWSDRVNIVQELEHVPFNIQLFRQQMFDAWKARAVELSKANTMPVSREQEACYSCARALDKPLLCSGCRSVAYCSPSCQKKHWRQEHKHVCSKELLLLSSLPGKYYKACVADPDSNS